ncbi:hypothetical protein C5E05_05790 [Pseudoclavibacter sp. AY1H1]|nr:hypothetical protein C5E05_05790 [Pseudoclavibacter sp. AY1H1]
MCFGSGTTCHGVVGSIPTAARRAARKAVSRDWCQETQQRGWLGLVGADIDELPGVWNGGCDVRLRFFVGLALGANVCVLLGRVTPMIYMRPAA